jgi:hypothetical protein
MRTGTTAAGACAMRVNLAPVMLMASLRPRNDEERRRLDNQSWFRRGFIGWPPEPALSDIERRHREFDARHGGASQPRCIRVNCIAPGTVYTPMVASRGMTAEMRKARSERTLLSTEGTGWDIGDGALFLASDESRWITGITCRSTAAPRQAARDRRCRPANPRRAKPRFEAKRDRAVSI